MNSKASKNGNVLVLNGPNLNLLGQREPEIYGNQTLADIEKSLQALAHEHHISISMFQSNSESDLIGHIHDARANTDFIIINAAAFTHTSIALRDALVGVAIPFYEVHISNIYQREEFRHHSYLADVAKGTLSGFGTFGYSMALLAIIKQIQS